MLKILKDSKRTKQSLTKNNKNKRFVLQSLSGQRDYCKQRQ